MSNIEVKLRRGTEEEHDTTNGGFTGAEGEVTVDTTNNTLRVHDNSTAGGHELRKKSDAQFGSSLFVTNLGGSARIEVGGSSGAYVDLKSPDSDDRDGRIQIEGNEGSMRIIGIYGLDFKTDTGTQTALTINTDGILNLNRTPVYADDTAAGAGGLSSGDIYKTSTGELRVKV